MPFTGKYFGGSQGGFRFTLTHLSFNNIDARAKALLCFPNYFFLHCIWQKAVSGSKVLLSHKKAGRHPLPRQGDLAPNFFNTFRICKAVTRVFFIQHRCIALIACQPVSHHEQAAEQHLSMYIQLWKLLYAFIAAAVQGELQPFAPSCFP